MTQGHNSKKEKESGGSRLLRHPIVSGAVLIVLSALATVLLTPVDLPSAKLWLLGAFPEAKDSETLIMPING